MSLIQLKFFETRYFLEAIASLAFAKMFKMFDEMVFEMKIKDQNC